MSSPVRSSLRSLRAAPDRWAHAGRRRAARLVIRGLGPIDSLVFVCHGNVCRSPFAAAWARRRPEFARAGVTITSAGFIGPDREPPAEAMQAAQRCGIDLTGHRSQLVSALDYSARPLVLVMNAQQQRTLVGLRPRLTGRVLILGDLDPEQISAREIADPWGKSALEFDSSYGRLVRCVMAIPFTPPG